MRSQKVFNLALAFVLLLAPQALIAQYAISTVAGGGPNGLAALNSSIGYPGSIAFDSGGNTYIADSFSSRIFEIDTLGNLTVVAGNGTTGYSGDGGQATSAALNKPEGIFVDGSDNIFVADTDNCLIREISGGIITTVAGGTMLPCPGYSGDGGPATSAQLADPYGVFVDGSGNIFIADTDNCLIREVSGGIITTVAGSTSSGCGYSGDGGAAQSAQLDEPQALYVASGNIFIADTFNSLIRVVNTGTAAAIVNGVSIPAGDIQTVAGNNPQNNGACGTNYNGTPAVGAQLCTPGGVFVDGAGNLFIADTSNFVISEVPASNVVATVNINVVAGTLGTAGYSNGTSAITATLNYPANMIVDGNENIFIADTDNFVVREVTASNGEIQTKIGNNTLAYSGDGASALDAELYTPGSVATDSAGNIYIADTANSLIRVVNTGTTAISIAGVTIQPGYIQTVAGSYYVSANPLVPCEYSGTPVASTSATLCNPGGVFVDNSGNIFIADTQNNVIRVVNPNAPGGAGITIATVNIPAGDIATVAGTGALCSGSASACGDGGLAINAELNTPNGVAVDSAGNIFIADTDDFVIREVASSSGGISTVAGNYTECIDPSSPCGDGSTAINAQLNFPQGVFVDVSEDVFIADTLDERIREVTASNGSLTNANISTVAGSGTRGYAGDGAAATSAALDTPFGVSVDRSGDIFIADTENSAIREVAAATGFIQTVAGIGPPPTPGFAGDGGQATSAELNSPTGLAVSSVGNLFIADTDNARIRELKASIFVTVAPNPVTVVTNALQQFNATVTGTGDTSVNWQVNGVPGGNSTVGTITTSGLFTAPATPPTPSTVTITAISQADNTTTGSAQATIANPSGTVTVTVSTNPQGVTQIYTSSVQAFVATVTGTTNTAVTWYVEGSQGGDATYGTIDTSGNYTAPANVPSPATVVIEAVSQADSTAIGTDSVTIIAAPSGPQPAPQTISPGGTATYSITLNPSASEPTITLSCLQSSLPPGATCSFAPATITPGPSPAPSTLTIKVPSGSASLNNRHGTRPQLYFALAFVPLAGLLFVGAGLRSMRRSWLLLAGLVISLLLLNACGGGGGNSGSGSTTYKVKVQGAASQSSPVTITTAVLTVTQ